MPRPHNGEMPPVEGCDRGRSEPLCGDDDRSIHGSKRQIAILRDQFRDAEPIAGDDRIGREVARREIAEEANLSFGTQPCLEEVGDLGDHELRNDQRPLVLEQQGKARLVVAVVFVDVGVQGPGIDEESYRRASRRRICSILRAVS